VAAQNFKIKNGLTVGTTEVIDSSGDLTNAAFGTAAKEAIDDQVNTLMTAGSGISLAYDDSAGTLTVTRDAETGDIEGVVAGTNLSGGGTSGTVTLNVEQELTNSTAPFYHKVAVTVVSDSGNKYAMDGNTSGGVAVRLMPNIVYRFDQSDSSNANHPLRFSETSDGTHNSGAEISDGYLIYNKVGTPGSAGAYTEVAFDQESNDTLYTYCSAHSGMGQTVTLGYAGDITGVTAGDGLSGGGATGAVSLALDLSELTAAVVDPATDSIAIIDAGDGSSKKEAIADLATMQAGDGLSASSGAFAVNVDDSSIETSSDSLRVKAGGVTNAMLAGSIANAKLANSAITIAGSSTSLGGTVLADTDALTEGSTNLYLTNERIDDRVNALIVGGSNITSTYDDAAGTLTLAGSAAYADSDARGAISVTDSGGDGSLAYNNSTGVITYTGPSASEVRTHITAGTGIGISSGEVSIGQAVATSSNVQFANLTLSGDLTVNGTTTTVSSTNSVIADALIELGNGTSGSPANDAGFVIERGSSDNVFIGWDESADAVTFGTGSFTGASTGNLTITPSAVNTGALTITNASNSGGTARNVYQSTSAPTGGDGAVGDLWILYS
jgi:hypothetical protein